MPKPRAPRNPQTRVAHARRGDDSWGRGVGQERIFPTYSGRHIPSRTLDPMVGGCVVVVFRCVVGVDFCRFPGVLAGGASVSGAKGALGSGAI